MGADKRLRGSAIKVENHKRSTQELQGFRKVGWVRGGFQINLKKKVLNPSEHFPDSTVKLQNKLENLSKISKYTMRPSGRTEHRILR